MKKRNIVRHKIVSVESEQELEMVKAGLNWWERSIKLNRNVGEFRPLFLDSYPRKAV